MRAGWVEHYVCLPLTRRLTAKERWENRKNNYCLNWHAFICLRLYPSLWFTQPARERLWNSPKVQQNVFFVISTLLMQFASHKGPAPPAAKGLSVKHKYNIMGVDSLLLADKPNPEVFWEPWDPDMEVGFRLRAQDSQLNGCRFESWLHHLLIAGPWLSPQSLGFLIWTGTVAKIKWDRGSAWCTGPATT